IAQERSNFKTSLILGLLWSGSFALFNNTIYYLAFLAFFGALVLHLLQQSPKDKFRLKKISTDRKAWLNLLKVSPIIFVLFLFFPRFHGFLPSANSQGQGVVGYSKSINNSDISNLKLSSKTSFYAQTSQELAPKDLYWRGRVHIRTDGYNWRPSQAPPEKSLPLAMKEESIEYQMKYEQNLHGDLVLLDSPLRVTDASARFYQDKAYNTFKTYRKDRKIILTAVSNTGARLKTTLIRSREEYLQLPQFLPNAFKELNDSLRGETPDDLVQAFQNFLRAGGFQYTLNPGAMPSLASFLEKKTGFCTHYASLLGILLRSRQIPARLVSGFQGGEYNEVGGYYTVRSSDAHAWVEYYDQGAWKRIDPTAFVSPSRIQSGTEQLLAGADKRPWWQNNILYSGLVGAKQRLNNLNYKLSAFFDSYDREKQKLLAKRLNLDIEAFYLTGALFLFALAIGAFIAMSSRHKSVAAKEDVLFYKFEKFLAKKGIIVEKSMTEERIKKLCAGKDVGNDALSFIRLYQKIKYQKRSNLYPKLKAAFKKL
ncbi:MAG: DUF3488 and transglutaminase-like domain-containing protein, partial [Bacteriovoracaceae bacterium]